MTSGNGHAHMIARAADHSMSADVNRSIRHPTPGVLPRFLTHRRTGQRAAVAALDIDSFLIGKLRSPITVRKVS
jgi:hypothetical protein